MIVAIVALSTLPGQVVQAGDTPSSAEPAPTTEPVSSVEEAGQESEQTRLRERAAARWQQLIKRDFDAAYEFEAPSYRGAFDKRQFSGRFGSDVGWTGAKVADVQMGEEGTTATVAVDVDYKVILPGTDRIVSDTRRFWESWLFDDNTWWHLSKNVIK